MPSFNGYFSLPIQVSEHHSIAQTTGDVPDQLMQTWSPQLFSDAYREIQSWEGYAATPLHSLTAVVTELEVREVLYKDESGRFGLGSFKAIGGAYAVMCALAELLSESEGRQVQLSELSDGSRRTELQHVTVTAATDGNHGRAVAWGAKRVGCVCRIFVHRDVSEGRQQALEELGADVVRVDGNYDESVHACAAAARENDWIAISDTSYPGYDRVPRLVMAGYSVIASEILMQAEGQPISHVFLPAGVGGLAAAIAMKLWQEMGDARPILIIVESDRSACLLESARQGRASTVDVVDETVMAGLSCGEASFIAWDILAAAGDHFVTLPDDGVAPAMRLFADGATGAGNIEAGECAVAGFLALCATAANSDLRRKIQLDRDSRVLLIGTEGATDREIYQRMLEA